jgi:hypothetical protein
LSRADSSDVNPDHSERTRATTFLLYGKMKLRYGKGYYRATEMAYTNKYRPVETTIS